MLTTGAERSGETSTRSPLSRVWRTTSNDGAGSLGGTRPPYGRAPAGQSAGQRTRMAAMGAGTLAQSDFTRSGMETYQRDASFAATSTATIQSRSSRTAVPD